MLIVRSRRVLTLVVAAVALVTVGPAAPVSAQAEQDCVRNTTVPVGEKDNGDLQLGVDVVDTCETEGSGGSGGGEHTCRSEETGSTVPCVDPAKGWWSHSENCYVKPYDPPPPPGDALWEGHDPSEGAIYLLSCPVGGLGFSELTEFRAEEPEQPSVAELAQQAIDTIALPGPQIGIAPDPSGAGLVGLPVWLWTEDRRATWGPVPGQATIPGVITVTARAEAARITWDMGDGNTVMCENPGTPYEASFGSRPSPTCGHVYAAASAGQPDGRFTITATTDWRVTWWVEPRGSGAESDGDVGFLRPETTSVRINELQVVTS